MSEIRAEHITIAYDDKTVIQNLSTKIADGKITTIIGANGCGKSTLLKALTRIQAVKAGQILIDGKAIADLPTNKKRHQSSCPASTSGQLTDEDYRRHYSL